jgi:hypothetical protein
MSVLRSDVGVERLIHEDKVPSEIARINSAARRVHQMMADGIARRVRGVFEPERVPHLMRDRARHAIDDRFPRRE